jgi:hypothetical protein
LSRRVGLVRIGVYLLGILFWVTFIYAISRLACR